MSETKAIIALFAVTISVTAALFVGLDLLGARDEVIVVAVLAWTMIPCLSAGFIVGHYSDQRR